MKYILISLYCFILISCVTIPDQAYHKIACATPISCSERELDAHIKPVTNMVIVNGISTFRQDQVIAKEGDIIDPTTFQLLYLEYAETGEKFEGNRQLALIKRAIATAEKPIYLIVYINSWNNNASTMAPSPDVVSFPYLLARRSFQNPNMNVIGVYIGWRGKKYEHFPATLLSVKDRAKAADTIGGRGEIRADIIAMVNHVQQSEHSGYTLIVGKSFGGRILSRAFLDDLAQTTTVKQWPLGERSLLVTLNSAIGADAFDRIYQKMPAPDPSTGLALQRPLWINLTSKDDWITKSIFPKARLIGQKLSDWSKKNTIGHHMPYISHSITIERSRLPYSAYECTFIQDIFMQGPPRARSSATWFRRPISDSNQANQAKSTEKTRCPETRYLYENKNAKGAESRYCTTILRPLHPHSDDTLGYMWNFQTDESVIGYSAEEARVIKNSGKHNSYVQTTLGRMADDMLFTTPEQ
ncbi:hypothetical protein [Psychrobacter sp. 16-MNA-CIBAN-0192]|uniref:hypothetical protein n=1 Tax=Psychrobacter sp. 16-MNA-CIBAN-0192 TaxID=3140448 RepID=UPI00333007FC